MRKLLLFLAVLGCLLVCSEAQAQKFSLFGNKKKKSAAVSPEKIAQMAANNLTCTFLPNLGIERPDVPIRDWVHFNTVTYQEEVRKTVTSSNRDATRFLEKAVAENNVEKAGKLLQAGASAFISYEMIDKKQYDMIDLMHQNNPMLIRYSQLLHYACVNSESAMIDFLIERNASLDLNGYYIEEQYDHHTGDTYGPYYIPACRWNNDQKYRFTPVDMALAYGKHQNVKYIMEKYKKYPTLLGCITYLDWTLDVKPLPNDNLAAVESFVRAMPFADNVPYSIKDVLSTRYYNIDATDIVHNQNNVYYESVLTIAVWRYNEFKQNKNVQSAKRMFALIEQMLEKGADPNLTMVRYFDGVGYKVTPLFYAMRVADNMDLVKLLRSKGASTEMQVYGKPRRYTWNTTTIDKCPILDEYKEYLMLEGL